MSPDPWRPMDVPDDILNRSTRPDPVLEVFEGIDPHELMPDADTGYVIMLPGADGLPQPVLWPMVLHKHTDECGRA